MDFALSRLDRRIIGGYLWVSMAALALGLLFGPLQALDKAGVNIYPFPQARYYYQGLSLHGVAMVLLWTTFFISGFLSFVTSWSLRRPLASPRLTVAAFATMVTGTVLAATALLLNLATVMFTAYPPLKASPAYYVGLALVVVGTWLVSANVWLTYRAWRRENPGARTPLPAFGALVTLAMWSIASLGIAVEFVAMLIPWSLGLLPGINPLLARSLFWFTGHPIVYFWILPAYLSWYFMVPAQAGGRLFSEPLARLAFLLFIPLSLPVGFHHQYTDPGVATGFKWVHAILTFAVFFPSALTMFTVLASLEVGARRRGGRGLVAWFRALPWDDPSLAAQVLAMILFAFGGVSGLINASYNLNLVVHNTLWVVGHFHLTVGTAVTLTFMGIAYWLVPHLTGRALWSRRLALVQAWLWFIGMALLGRGLHWLGLIGAPRRSMLSHAPYYDPEWRLPGLLVAVGGSIAFISGLMFLANMVLTAVRSRVPANVTVPNAEPLLADDPVPAWLDRVRPWVVATAALAALAWLPMLWRLAVEGPWTIAGVKLW